MITKILMILVLFTLGNIVSAVDTASVLTSGGSIDSGGGNTYKGKPIEFYIGSIRDYNVYKKKIIPKLKIFEKILPGLASDFNQVVDSKLWYFIPGELYTLPPHITGVPLNSDQQIIQRIKSVWINKVAFDAMEEKYQETMIWHELVLGARIFNSNNNDHLNADDHDEIRAFAYYLIRSDEYDIEELDNESIEGVNSYYARHLFEIDSIYDFFKFLEGTTIDKTLPNENYASSHLLDPDTVIGEVKQILCNTNFKWNNDSNSITITSSYKKLLWGKKDWSDNYNETSLTVYKTPSYFPLHGPYRSSYLQYNVVEGNTDGIQGEFRKLFGFNSDDNIHDLYINWVVCRKKISEKCIWENPTKKELARQGLEKAEIITCNSKSY